MLSICLLFCSVLFWILCCVVCEKNENKLLITKKKKKKKRKSPVSCLNDYRPIALTPIMMKCFERLVMQKIKTSLPNTLDPLQFAYRPNRSTDDAISTTLHLALTHLENKESYVRMLFIDFSSAFNTIIPQQLINKLNLLGLNNSLCNWILDFLTGRQSVSATTPRALPH